MPNAKCAVCGKDLKTEEKFGYKYLCRDGCVAEFLKNPLAAKPVKTEGVALPDPLKTLNVGQAVAPVSGPVEPAIPVKPDLCPVCGGTSRGRGYAHKDGCANVIIKEKHFCPDCGGPAKGRGFRHVLTPRCPRLSVE